MDKLKIGELRKEILELRKELSRFESRLKKIEVNLYRSSVDELKKELEKEYPNIRFDNDLLELVGTLPSNPAEMDKEVIRKAIEWSIE